MDSEEKSQITHYVPEWVLRKFRKPYLFELDIYTGRSEQRRPKKAGSGLDLWPNDIEDTLSIHDNAAAQIYRDKIEGHKSVNLSLNEMTEFSLWLAHFYVRSPKRLVQTTQLFKDKDYSIEGMIRKIYAEPEESIAWIKRNNVETYDKVVARYGDQAQQVLLDRLAYHIHVLGPNLWPTPKFAQHKFMRTASTTDYAKILQELNWTWLYSDHAFVIGDDPLVSWQPSSGRWDYGMALPDAEITFPLTLNLTLFLRRNGLRKTSSICRIRPMVARTLNCRQRYAAIKYVYGNTPEALDFITRPVNFTAID